MSTRQRIKRATESFKSAADCIGPIGPDTSLFAITRGQFSMIDVILYVLSQLGKAHISVWTWTIADYETECIQGLMARSEILSARLVIDASADRRNQAIIETWRQKFGDDQVRICKNHAKIARVWTEDIRVLARGSFNLNQNPRFEQLDLSANDNAFDLVTTIEDALPVLPRKWSNLDAEHATGCSKSWEHSQLEMFRAGGLKTWSPNK